MIKIGAVVVREVVSPESLAVSKKEVTEDSLTTQDSGLTTYEILIIQPLPKNKGEVPHFVLPRGSRQYQLNGAWIDVRDVATAEKHRDTLEPFERALTREIEEEAGVNAAQLAAARVIEMGALPFQSRSKGVYPIYWYLVVPDPTTAATLAEQIPMDAMSIRWASLGEIKTMAAQGTFSAGYVPVIESALQILQTKP